MPHYRWLATITAVFVTSLIVSNIIAVKLITVGPLALTAAVVIFPVSYIFGDVLTEVYGYARARQVIWIGFGCNVLAVAAIYLSIRLPASPFWAAGSLESAQASQQAYEAVLGFAPRLLLASFIAYLVGEFVNSFIMAKMKILSRGRHLWMRTIGSTVVGQLVDSGIFIVVAFVGVVPADRLVPIIVSQWLVKSAYEALATPLTYVVVFYLKRSEKVDHYDHATDFNPFLWNELRRP
jgi:queuosine precursor transporter